MKRTVYLSSAYFFVALGFVGAFVPVLPTTPFLLLAAILFARSSKRSLFWLLRHPMFGESIRDWYRHRAMRAHVKRRALFALVLAFALSISLVPVVGIKLFLAGLGIALFLFLLRIPVLAH